MIETFVDKAEDQPHIGKQFVQPMMDPILGDYARNVPDAREFEVLSLFATIINKYVSLSLTHSHTHIDGAWRCLHKYASSMPQVCLTSAYGLQYIHGYSFMSGSE